MGRPKGSKNKIDREVEDVEVIDSPVAVEDVPRETIKEKVRVYSTNKDHMGEGEPLCLNCGHRQDMHYIEHRWTEKIVGKNLQGDFLQIDELKRKKSFDGARPCQHACLCKGYK